MTDHCGTCRFWDGEKADQTARCKRNAPVPMQISDGRVTRALTLLAWWYIAEHSSAKVADEQLDTFTLNIEGYEWDEDSMWPKTEAGEWCGEWESRAK